MEQNGNMGNLSFANLLALPFEFNFSLSIAAAS